MNRDYNDYRVNVWRAEDPTGESLGPRDILERVYYYSPEEVGRSTWMAAVRALEEYRAENLASDRRTYYLAMWVGPPDQDGYRHWTLGMVVRANTFEVVFAPLEGVVEPVEPEIFDD